MSNRGNAGAPIVCMYRYGLQYCFRFCCCCMLRTPGIRSDDVCLAVALDVFMLS